MANCAAFTFGVLSGSFVCGLVASGSTVAPFDLSSIITGTDFVVLYTPIVDTSVVDCSGKQN